MHKMAYFYFGVKKIKNSTKVYNRVDCFYLVLKNSIKVYYNICFFMCLKKRMCS